MKSLRSYMEFGSFYKNVANAFSDKEKRRAQDAYRDLSDAVMKFNAKIDKRDPSIIKRDIGRILKRFPKGFGFSCILTKTDIDMYSVPERIIYNMISHGDEKYTMHNMDTNFITELQYRDISSSVLWKHGAVEIDSLIYSYSCDENNIIEL